MQDRKEKKKSPVLDIQGKNSFLWSVVPEHFNVSGHFYKK